MSDKVINNIVRIYKALSEGNRKLYQFLFVVKGQSETTVLYYRVAQGDIISEEEHTLLEALEQEDKETIVNTLMFDLYGDKSKTVIIGKGEIKLSNPEVVMTYVVSIDTCADEHTYEKIIDIENI